MENLYDSLIKYTDSDFYPFHMPGHKRNNAFSMASPLSLDITEIDNFDNLHASCGLLAQINERAAALYGAKSSLMLVNGSSGGLLTAICAATRKGDKVLVARNCHVSVYNALILNELSPVYLMPRTDNKTGLLLDISPEDVEAAFIFHKDIKLVIITSPTYDGFVSDISAISSIVHAHGAALLVDEAHGAHFGFHSAFPQSAVRLGADLVVQSLHKTLPALTQTGLLHICTDRVDLTRIKKYFDIFHTTSPSYVLMASIDRCLSFLSDSAEAFASYAKCLENFYDKASFLKHLSVFCTHGTDAGRDRGKILLFSGDSGMTGRDLYDILLKDYHLQPEMCTLNYCMLMTSVCDTDDGFLRLEKALCEMDQIAAHWERKTTAPHIYATAPLPQTCAALHFALNSASAELALKKAAGSISTAFVYVYPPGIPLLAPGEKITEAVAEHIRLCIASGLEVSNVRLADGEVYVKVLCA